MKFRETVTADVVPVPAAGGQGTMNQALRTLRKRRPQRRRDVVSRLIGEDNEDSIIPDDAEEIFSGGKDGDTHQKTEQPRVSNQGTSEPLIDPAVALVAPDVTPNADVLLDPTMAPRPTSQALSPALQTVLGKATATSTPSPQAASDAPPVAQTHAVSPTMDSINAMLGISPQVKVNGDADELRKITEMSYDPMTAATTPGLPMPEHVYDPNSASKLIESTRGLLKIL